MLTIWYLNLHLCTLYYRGPQNLEKTIKYPIVPQSVNFSAEPMPEELQEEFASIQNQFKNGM